MRTLVIGRVTFCSDALAWGDHRHKVACEIAMRVAEPSTRQAIRQLIAADPQFDFFSDSCAFPDHPRTRTMTIS